MENIIIIAYFLGAIISLLILIWFILTMLKITKLLKSIADTEAHILYQLSRK